MTGRDKTAQWLKPLDPAAGPRYLQIADLIGQAIDAGLLRPGDRLPPQRKLADLLDVDLTTVTRAYAEARHRNLLDAVGGRGSFVSSRKPDTDPTIDLSMNIPPAPRGVRLADLMQRGVAEVLNRSSADLLMSYHVGQGSLADRSAAAAWLEPALGAVDPARIVISAGAQPALTALLSSLTRPGDVVLAEPLTYPGFLAAAAELGRVIVAVEADEQGVRPDALARASREHGARLAYLLPTLHNPTTVTMPEERRRAIARAAAELDLVLVEDDPYWLLAGDAPPPLATFAADRTYYLATLSKTLTPGLRTAYVVAPGDEAAERLTGALRAFTLMPAPLMTALATTWIRDGSASDLLTGIREEASARQVLARAILPATARSHPHGLHLWQPLPTAWDRHALVQAVRQEGLGVTLSDAFSASEGAPDAIRISLGAVGERSRLAAALKTLAAVLGKEPAVRRSIVV